MRYFKVILSEIVGRGAKPRERKYYLIPQEGDFDEDGMPIFSEELIRQLPDTQRFSKLIKFDKVNLKYEIYETPVKDEPEEFADFDKIEDDEQLKLIGGNDFVIDVNRKMRIYSDEVKKKSSNMPYYITIISIIALVAVVYIFTSGGFGGSSEQPVESESVSDESIADESAAEPLPAETTDVTTAMSAITVTSDVSSSDEPGENNSVEEKEHKGIWDSLINVPDSTENEPVSTAGNDENNVAVETGNEVNNGSDRPQ